MNNERTNFELSKAKPAAHEPKPDLHHFDNFYRFAPLMNAFALARLSARRTVPAHLRGACRSASRPAMRPMMRSAAPAGACAGGSVHRTLATATFTAPADATPDDARFAGAGAELNPEEECFCSIWPPSRPLLARKPTNNWSSWTRHAQSARPHYSIRSKLTLAVFTQFPSRFRP